MSRQEVIQKIKKLQKLQINAKEINSLGEANNAAEKIQHLLMQYNLSLEEVDREDETTGPLGPEVQRVDYSSTYKKAEGTWIGYLAHYIAVNNLCEVVLGGGYPAYYVIGSQENRETVIFIVDQLVAKFRQLEQQSWSNYHGPVKRNKYRRDFLKGASLGIYNKLSEQRRKMEQESSQVEALVLANKDKLEKAKKDYFNHLGKSRTRKLQNNSAFQDGLSKGRSTDIHSGLGSRGSRGQLNS